MKRVALAAVLLAFAISASVSLTSARTASQAGNDLLQLLPDGKSVVVVDVQRMTASSLWAAISAQNKVKTQIEKAQAEIAEMGVNLTEVQAVAFTFSGEGTDDPTVAVTGGFDKANVLDRLRASGKMKLTSEKYKNYEIFKAEPVKTATDGQAKESSSSRKDDGYFTFYDARTAVVGSGAAVRASIDTKLALRPSIAQNAKLSEAIAQSPSAAIRFALEFTPGMAKGLNSNEVPLPNFDTVKLIFGSVDVASGIELIATLRNDSAEHAKNMADRLNGLLEMVRGFMSSNNDPKMAPIVGALKGVSITGNDVDVKISGSLPAELITQFLK